MEEIDNRFEIVRLASFLGDHDTILIQCERLLSLSKDKNMQNIVSLLKSKNYRQALFEMMDYRQNLEKSFLDFNNKQQMNMNQMANPQQSSPQNIAGQNIGLGGQNVGMTGQNVGISGQNVGMGTMNMNQQTHTPQPQPVQQQTSPQSNHQKMVDRILRDEEPDEVIGLDDMKEIVTQSQKDRVKEYEPIPEFPTEDILKDFKREIENVRDARINSEFQKIASGAYDKMYEEEPTLPLSEPQSMKEQYQQEELQPNNTNVTQTQSLGSDFDQASTSTMPTSEPSITPSTDSMPAPAETQEVNYHTEARDMRSNTRYSAISYIDQKFQNMLFQYPPIKDTGATPEVVKQMKEKLSSEEYTDEMIERLLDHYFKFKEAGRVEDAAKVLLLAASSESRYAKFLLARELFKGEVLRKNHTESFNLINSLADQNYPDAICDLGQFYEHGIAIVKDIEMAKLLYKEAADLGLERAKKHFERLDDSSKGVKGILRKLSLAKNTIKKM